MNASEPWWGEDVIPPIRWQLVYDGMVVEGGDIPNGYGIAWRIPGRDAYVLMPEPLNLIARALREVYYCVLFPCWGRADAIQRAQAKAYYHGYFDRDSAFPQPGARVSNPYEVHPFHRRSD